MTRPVESMCRPLRNERGQSLALVGIGLGTVVFLAFAVVAVDISRLAFTATEVQTLADSTAIAGAIALLKGADTTQAASTVAGGNQVDGTNAVVPCSGGSPCADLTIGTLSTAWKAGGCTATSLDPCFTAGGVSPNAVKSTAQATVNNILAAMLGSSTTTVTKTAVGAIGGVGDQQPTLPLAICEECFGGVDCVGSGCVTLTQTPSGTNTTAWTGFFGGTGTSSIAALLPPPCGSGSSTVPDLTVGDTINLNNGQQSQSQILQTLQCMVCPPNNVPSFVIPVIQCGGCGGPIVQSAPVVGFTTIVVSSFNYSSQNSTPNLCGPSQGALKSMNLSEIKNTDLSGPPSGGLFGTLVAGMVG